MRLYWVSWLLSLSWCLLRFTEKFVSALATGFSTACYRDYPEASNSRSTLACLGGSAKLIELHRRQIRPSGMLLVLFGLLSLLNIIVAWIDIRQGIIPDWLNLTIAGLGLSTALVIGGPWAGLEAAGVPFLKGAFHCPALPAGRRFVPRFGEVTCRAPAAAMRG